MMSLNSRAALGFLLSAFPELSWVVIDRVVPPVMLGVMLLGLLALLWWQFAAGHAWAAWILAVLMATAMLWTISLGTIFSTVLAIFSFGEAQATEAGTLRVATIARACSYLAAFAIVVMELRSRARKGAPGSG